LKDYIKDDRARRTNESDTKRKEKVTARWLPREKQKGQKRSKGERETIKRENKEKCKTNKTQKW